MKCACKSPFRPVTHVIFDLDGVIIDSEGVYEDAFRKTLENYDRKFNEDFYREVSGLTSPKLAKLTIEKYNLQISPDSFVDTYREYSKKGLENLELLPGVERLIKHLHANHVPLAIATSSAKESFQFKTKKFKNLMILFDHIVCGGDPDVKEGKPAPDIYLICAERFSGAPNSGKCLVFEDTENGMRAGLAAKMQVVLIPNSTLSEQVWRMATVKIDHFDDFVPEWFGLPPYS